MKPRPLQNNTSRLSIRTLNDAITLFSQERIRTKKSIIRVKFLIDKIPKSELARYSQHCVPVAAYNNSSIILRYMKDSGMDLHENWALFIALIKGYDSVSHLLVSNRVGLAEVDEIPLAWAAYMGGSLTLNELFEDRKYIVFNKYTPVNHHRGVVLRNMIALMEGLCKRRDIEWDFPVNSNMTQHLISQCSKIHTRSKDWECQPPFIDFDKVKIEVINMLNECKERSIDDLDRLGIIVRCYGILRWNFFHMDIFESKFD